MENQEKIKQSEVLLNKSNHFKTISSELLEAQDEIILAVSIRYSDRTITVPFERKDKYIKNDLLNDLSEKIGVKASVLEKQSEEEKIKEDKQ